MMSHPTGSHQRVVNTPRPNGKEEEWLQEPKASSWAERWAGKEWDPWGVALTFGWTVIFHLCHPLAKSFSSQRARSCSLQRSASWATKQDGEEHRIWRCTNKIASRRTKEELSKLSYEKILLIKDREISLKVLGHILVKEERKYFWAWKTGLLRTFSNMSDQYSTKIKFLSLYLYCWFFSWVSDSNFSWLLGILSLSNLVCLLDASPDLSLTPALLSHSLLPFPLLLYFPHLIIGAIALSFFLC